MTAPLVEEVVVSLSVNGTASFEWRCTPYDLEALVIGRLFVSALITNPDDVHLTIEPADETHIRVAARVDVSRAKLRPSDAHLLGIPATEMFTKLFRDLFDTVDARHESGGMHAAAATDGTRIIVQVEDVGRHNTIDKIVGMMLLSGLSFGQHGLLTSSRVSGEIAHKVGRAGFAWLASRSIPTTLAVRFANEAGLPIIGRAASKNAFIY